MPLHVEPIYKGFIHQFPLADEYLWYIHIPARIHELRQAIVQAVFICAADPAVINKYHCKVFEKTATAARNLRISVIA